METPRRTFLLGSASAACSLVLPLALNAQTKTAKKAENKKEEGEEDVSTNEDLMREHGVLNRILLIYDDSRRRLENKNKDKEFNPDVTIKAAGLIKKFIEDYHEKLEENHLFPRFEKAGKLVELTKTLRAQHAVGRSLTDNIIASVKAKNLDSAYASMGSFIHMYRPHEAREDTVLFPALHQIVSRHEYDAMGEQFEAIERKTFGGDGFDMAVDQVTEFEKTLGIYDLSQFTPHL
jgi:hemerythrin-like domain-containing protein